MLNSIFAYIHLHWVGISLALYMLSSAIVAVTPKRYQTDRWYGFALKIMRFLSTHVHLDEFGTLTIPGTKIVLAIGHDGKAVLVQSPDVTVTVPLPLAPGGAVSPGLTAPLDSPSTRPTPPSRR